MIASRGALLLYSAVFLSGAAGLIYEVAWLKALSLIFGGTVYGVTTVLVAFMGGLGLGSWALGRRLDRHPRPVHAYALLEAGIAVAAPLTFALLPLLRSLYVGAGGGTGVRFVASALLLLLPTFLMGGTFPVLVRVFRAGEAETGGPVSRLYALNTAGAVAGTLAAGFVLVPYAGILRTALLAAGANAAAGLLAWVGGRGAGVPACQSGAGIPACHSSEGRQECLPYLAWVAFLSGATAMILEVAWTRLLVAPLGGSTYAFTVLLAAFLVGIAAGSRLFVRLARRWVPDRPGLACLQLGVALAGLLTLALWRLVPSLVFALFEDFSGAFWGIVALQFLAAFLILLLPAMLYGVSFPWLAALYAPGEEGAGSRVGRLYAVNTAGAIAGTGLAGFLLIPRLGSYAALAAAIGASAAAGVLLLSGMRRLAALGGFAALTLGVGLAGFFSHSPLDQEAVVASYYHSPLYRSGLSLAEIAAARDYVFMEDGLNASVSVYRTERNHALKINGKVDASEMDMKTQVLSAALPLAMHPAPRRVLVIGFGSGVTTRVAVEWPGVERVDTVEIEPAVLRAAPYLKALNGEVYLHPRSRLIVDDARHFLFTTRESYDVIIAEASNPWIAGIGNLFTVEFYREARARLNEGGVFAQWMQGYQILPEDLALVARTLRTAFPHISLWRGEPYDFLLLASQDHAWPVSAHYEALFRSSSELRRLFWQYAWIERPEGIWAYFRLGSADLARFANQTSELNTDDRPRLEYRAPWRLSRRVDDAVQNAVAAARTNQGESPGGSPPGLSPRLGPLPVPLSPEERLAAAETLLRIGEVEPSRNLARPLLQEIPDSPGIWQYAGDLNRVLRKPPVSESSYRRALERGGGARALAGLALLAAETGNPEAEVRLRKAAESWSDDGRPSSRAYQTDVMLALARTLARSGRLEEAIEWQKRVIAAKQPSSYLHWAQLGELYLRKGDGAAAQEALDKSLALDPYSYVAHRLLGDVFLARGLVREAAREFRILLRYHPLREHSFYERAADALLRAGHDREARRALERSRRLFPPVAVQP